MYTDTIIRKVEADGEITSFNAVKMHGKEVKELRYADDTVLFAQTPEGLHSHKRRKGPVDYRRWQVQTCHSIEMKNLDLTNKKSGSGGKNRDHGPIGYKKK